MNPLIGTGEGPGGGVNLFPGAVMPFGMVQLSPETESHGYGYHYAQTDIQGFSMTHMSGPGCTNEGEVFFTATDGPRAYAARRSPLGLFAQRRERRARILPRESAAMEHRRRS